MRRLKGTFREKHIIIFHKGEKKKKTTIIIVHHKSTSKGRVFCLGNGARTGSTNPELGLKTKTKNISFHGLYIR